MTSERVSVATADKMAIGHAPSAKRIIVIASKIFFAVSIILNVLSGGIYEKVSMCAIAFNLFYIIYN